MAKWKLLIINSLLFLTFPISFLITNFWFGRHHYRWTHNLIKNRLETLTQYSMNSEEFFNKSLQRWQRKNRNLRSWTIDITKQPYREWTVEGLNGVHLSVRTYEIKPQQPWVIISHGWTENKFEVLHLADLYYKLNFNVLIYDSRAHGLSDKTDVYSTIGYLEKFDLIALVRWLKAHFPVNAIVLHGQSMGAATSVEAVKIMDPEHKSLIKACVIDGCFDNLLTQMLVIADQKFQVHKVFYKFGIYQWFKIKDHYHVDDVQPKSQLELVKDVPFLVIHGEGDHFVITKMGERIFKAKTVDEDPVISEYFPVSKGKHVESFQINPINYQTRLSAFFKKIKLIN